jgi:hypothetical protein
MLSVSYLRKIDPRHRLPYGRGSAPSPNRERKRPVLLERVADGGLIGSRGDEMGAAERRKEIVER